MPIAMDNPAIDWKPVIEIRSRIIYNDNRDISSATNDYQTRWDNRLRAGFDFKYGKDVSGQLRYQYNHSTLWTPNLNNSDDGSNLFLANVSVKRPFATFTIGRQIVSKGDRRLVDQSDFSQRPKVFDVVRSQTPSFDLMAGKVGMTSNVADYSNVGMLAHTWRAGETMAFYRGNNKLDVNNYTLDHRWTTKTGPYQLAAEGALQKGKAGGKALNSWFGHLRAQYSKQAATTWYAEANIASGGSSATETTLFDPLYGTGHTPYGLADLQGLRNMRHLEIGVRHQLKKNLSGVVSFNGYGLYDPSDGWYNTGGSINRGAAGPFRDATGKSGRDVGHEFNLGLTFTPNKRDTVTLELALFKPGNFVQKLNAGNAKNQFWGLLSYQGKF
ncbi:MAG: alginate export family protein [Fimbriimonas sp.]